MSKQDEENPPIRNILATAKFWGSTDPNQNKMDF